MQGVLIKLQWGSIKKAIQNTFPNDLGHPWPAIGVDWPGSRFAGQTNDPGNTGYDLWHIVYDWLMTTNILKKNKKPFHAFIINDNLEGVKVETVLTMTTFLLIQELNID